jgi:DNA-binding SARP family transcriptional activator
MDFRILGPLRVEVDGTPVQLGPKLRAVLTLLLLHANRVVPAAEVRAVLGATGRTPTRATVRSHIHHLRRVLERARPGSPPPATLVTAETGYLLRVEPERLDSVRFQRLVQEGRQAFGAGDPPTAAERLHAALRLWRGPIPEEVAAAPAVQDELARLEGLYLIAREARIQADLRVAAARYRSELAGRRVLVVLDNAASEAQARALLPGTPGSAAILTSRARLALHEAVPLTLDLLEEDDAVRLLARLDQQGRVDAEPGAGRRVARACGRLPLALQIAGARLGNRRTWTVAHLADRLADERRRLGELRVGDLDVRASFALSYRDLPAAEARTFRLLGLVETADLTPGPVAALTGTAVPQAEAILERLLDGRLLEQTRPGRYRLHNLLRLFAREQAEAQEPADQQDAARARLLAWYLATAEHADQLLTPAGQRQPTPPAAAPFPDRAAALAFLDRERGNLVAVTRHAAAHPDPAVAAIAWRLGDTLFRYFDLRKHWSAWQAVCEPAVQAAARAGSPADHARALNRLGIVYREQRRLAEAMAQQQQALAIARQAGTSTWRARSSTTSGSPTRTSGTSPPRSPATGSGWRSPAGSATATARAPPSTTSATSTASRAATPTRPPAWSRAWRSSASSTSAAPWPWSSTTSARSPAPRATTRTPSPTTGRAPPSATRSATATRRPSTSSAWATRSPAPTADRRRLPTGATPMPSSPASRPPRPRRSAPCWTTPPAKAPAATGR